MDDKTKQCEKCGTELVEAEDEILTGVTWSLCPNTGCSE